MDDHKLNDPTLIRGTLHLYSETGTEGGYWAIQDERFITTREDGTEHWSYDGLHPLRDGDYLKIIDPNGETYWEGRINLVQHEAFTQEVYGLWIHADQSGLDRKWWATPFFKEWKGELIRGVYQ